MGMLTQLRVLRLIRAADSPLPEGHQAARELRSIASAALPCVVKILLEGKPDDQIHAASALILLNSKGTVEPLIQVLASPHAGVRAKVADTLGFLRDERAIKPLVQLLDDADREVRCRAASALGTLRATEAVNPLVNILNESAEWQLRKSAASALGWITDARSLDALHAHLTDPSKRVRKSVKFALAHFHWKMHQTN